MHQELLQNSLEVCEIICSIDHLHKYPIRHDISANKYILQCLLQPELTLPDYKRFQAD